MNTTFSYLIIAISAVVGADEPTISPAVLTDGFLVHDIQSPFQKGTTQIKVLMPSPLEPNRKYPTIYVLPVEAKSESRYGDGLLEIKNQKLHEKHPAIFVAPTFSHLPWYCDHPTDSTIRQESYLLNVVVPFIERSYPVEAKPESRLLLGFSKSGWGAWSLLLRHPETFGRAAAWDAPMMTQQLGKYGTAPIFGTQENFEKYRITDLLQTNGHLLGPRKRLILTGQGNFQPEHERVHSLMDELKVPHEYRVGELRKHDWHSGWVSETVELLMTGRGDN